MSEVQEEELARTVLDVRIELMDRDFRTFEISALQSVQGENSAREAAVAIARALITAGYSKRDTASGLPAAIEARDKALERVKALEGALDKFWDTYGEFSDGLLFCSHCEAEGGNPNRRASWRDTPHDAGCPFGIARATHD